MYDFIVCEDRLLAISRVRFLYSIRTALGSHFRLIGRDGGVCVKDAQDIPIARTSGIRLPVSLPPCTASMVTRLCSWCSFTVGKPKIGGSGRAILDPALP